MSYGRGTCTRYSAAPISENAACIAPPPRRSDDHGPIVDSPISGADYRWRDVWPRKRRDLDLPPGQRVAPIMPRFSARPRRPPPDVPERPVIEVKGAVDRFEVTLDRLAGLPRVDLQADFHCVTTWSIPGLPLERVAIR